MKKLKITKVRRFNKDEIGMHTMFSNGEIFEGFVATRNDGHKQTVFKSNRRPGYWRQAFVPWDAKGPTTI
jgi:hypothetical protein